MAHLGLWGCPPPHNNYRAIVEMEEMAEKGITSKKLQQENTTKEKIWNIMGPAPYSTSGGKEGAKIDDIYQLKRVWVWAFDASRWTPITIHKINYISNKNIY